MNHTKHRNVRFTSFLFRTCFFPVHSITILTIEQASYHNVITYLACFTSFLFRTCFLPVHSITIQLSKRHITMWLLTLPDIRGMLSALCTTEELEYSYKMTELSHQQKYEVDSYFREGNIQARQLEKYSWDEYSTKRGRRSSLTVDVAEENTGTKEACQTERNDWERR